MIRGLLVAAGYRRRTHRCGFNIREHSLVHVALRVYR